MLLREHLCIYNFIKITIMRLRMKKYKLLMTVLVLCGHSYNAHSACSTVNACKEKCDRFILNVHTKLLEEFGIDRKGNALEGLIVK